MRAPVPAYRASIPPPAPIFDATVASYATEIPGIPAFLYSSDTSTCATSAKIVESSLCTHLSQTDLIAIEEFIPSWAECLLARMETIEGTISALQGAVKATNSRVKALEGTAINALIIAQQQGSIETLNGAVKCTNLRIDGLQAHMKSTKSWDESLKSEVDVMTKRFLALEGALNTTNSSHIKKAVNDKADGQQSQPTSAQFRHL
jgi:uncharacterized coiled-coil protein SlyX